MTKLLTFVSFYLVGVMISSGCARMNDLQYIGEVSSDDGSEEVSYYLDRATKIDFPNVHSVTPEEVSLSHEPRTIMDLNKDEIRDLSLEECIRTALLNSTVIRAKSSFLSPGNSILANPDRAASIYDPSIQSTGVLFGGRGVEAALAAFDANLSTSMTWGRNATGLNQAPAGSTLTSDTGVFDTGIQKNFGYGGSLEVGHSVNYTSSNATGQNFASNYVGNLSAMYRHPLLAGSGTEFTRIAGPISTAFGGLTGVNQGVLIARINHDLSLADFESNLTNLVKDVEDSYWELYLQYRTYDTNVSARNSALRTWRDSKRKLEIGGVRGFSVEDEAQARDRYFDTKAVTQQNLSLLYKNESALRRLIGLSVNDGAIIRPSDEPLTARIEPEWAGSVASALTNRVELRRQKWNIKSLELQLLAATGLVRPRFDFVAGYSINGLGNQLIDHDTSQPFNSFYDSISNQKQTGWSTGFVLEMPIGLRSAKAQVQNIELRLAKARDVLAAQELEIAHEVGNAFQELAEKYMTAQTYFNRREAAKDRAELFEKKFRVGTQTLDLLLRAQSSLADAEVAYFRSLVAYSQAIANLQYRQGTLLPFNNVFMAEGEWDPEAYFDAYRRAKSRTYAFDGSSSMTTRPPEFVVSASGWEASSEGSNAEPPPATRPMTTEPARFGLPSDGDGFEAVPVPEDGSATDLNGLNQLRKIPEPAPLNFLEPPGPPDATRPARSVAPDRASANLKGFVPDMPLPQTMAPTVSSGFGTSPTADGRSTAASTIELRGTSPLTNGQPDAEGFLPPIRVGDSGVTRVRAK
ncbi:MAG: TolC family protein [Planctomycetota bacterium]|nr:TolC family protein [Planctomycetota bacterium]